MEPSHRAGCSGVEESGRNLRQERRPWERCGSPCEKALISGNLKLTMCMPCGHGASGGRAHTYIRHLANRDLLPGRLPLHCSCSNLLIRAHLDSAQPHPNPKAMACRRAERRNLRSMPDNGCQWGSRAVAEQPRRAHVSAWAGLRQAGAAAGAGQ